VKLSVIVPAYNEEKLLPRSLRCIRSSLEAFDRAGWESEIIVCDNNSTDRTAERAQSGGAQVVFEPVNQIGRARNRGAEVATGDWLLFIDADSFPHFELFEALRFALESGRYFGGGAQVALEVTPGWSRCMVFLWNLISRCTGWAPGSFIFCSAAAWHRLGGFNPELFVAEEIEFSRRLKRLARENGRRLVILHRERLKTSARKLHLYTAWEFWKFMAGSVWHRGANFKDRAACTPWYDGRR
jgi:glycosyltransferase involved in cell wall biosynthesis